MSSPSQVAGATQEAAGKTAGTAKDEAQQVGQVATDAAADVVGTTKEQVGAVTGEAVNQVKDLLDQARSEFSGQAGTAASKLSESVRALSGELHEMGKAGQQGPASEVVRQLAERGDRLADYLGSRHPGDMVQELRRFASQRPGGFLLGALAAGVVTGRVVRGAAAASHDEPAGSPSYPPATVSLPSTGSSYGQAQSYSPAPLTVGDPGVVDEPVLDPIPYAAVPTISTVPDAAGIAPIDDDLVVGSGTTPLERDAWSR